MTPAHRRDLATKILLESARDLADDPMGIGEMLHDHLPHDDAGNLLLIGDEWDAEIDAISELIRTATITVTLDEAS